jgi:dihydroxyacetone kinase
MSVGLGVHGEPGVRDVPMGTAAEVADLLVDGVLAEEPPRGRDRYEGRAVVILNGLGTVKNEELYVVYGRVAQRLEEAGITPVLPEVGELMSSLDMAGLSLTVTFLDPELEDLWVAPVDTIAYRRGAVQERGRREVSADVAAADPIPEASERSRELAQTITKVLEVLRQTAVAAEPELGRLDAVAGDGDHGQGMSYGTTGASRAAADALARGAGARTLLVRAGEAWSEAAGGTSGALWGGALTAAGAALSDDAPAGSADIVRAVEQGGQAVRRLGGAEPGDKTMVDALVPFTTVLTERFASGDPLPRAWAQAAEAASHAARATAEIPARRGRSRVLGQKSVGTPDPGATSFAQLMSAVAESGLLEN